MCANLYIAVTTDGTYAYINRGKGKTEMAKHICNFEITNLDFGFYRRSEQYTVTGVGRVHVRRRSDADPEESVAREFHATSSKPFVVCVKSVRVRYGATRSEVRVYESVVDASPETATLSLQEKRRIENARSVIARDNIRPGTRIVVFHMDYPHVKEGLPGKMVAMHLEGDDPYFVSSLPRCKRVRSHLKGIMEIRRAD